MARTDGVTKREEWADDAHIYIYIYKFLDLKNSTRLGLTIE